MLARAFRCKFPQNTQLSTKPLGPAIDSNACEGEEGIGLQLIQAGSQFVQEHRSGGNHQGSMPYLKGTAV